MEENVTLLNQRVSKSHLILFVVQVLLIFVVVCVSLVNLSLSIGNNNLWTVLLTSCLGYILPNPRIKVLNGDINVTEKGKNDT